MPDPLRFAMASRPVPTAPETRKPAEYIWYGCDLVSGAIVEELPFVASGPLQRIIGAYTSASGSIAISDCPPNWSAATDPGRTMLVCVRASDERVMWGGMVLSRVGGSSETVTLNLATLEAYYDRRFVRTKTFTQQRVSVVAVNLWYDNSNEQGISVGWAVPALPDVIDRTYSDESDQTLYSALSDLMGSTGIEWTVEIDWTDAQHTAFKKTFTTGRPRLGVVDAVNPSAVFDMPGSVTEYELSEDYTSSKGANHITIFGDGEGESRPSSGPQSNEVLIDAGWPRFEFRATRSGVTQTETLIAHAQSMLAWKAQGAQIFTVTADATTGPLLGVDWSLGDVVGVDVYESPRHPDGFHINARSIGWELDVTSPVPTVTPLLQEESDDE